MIAEHLLTRILQWADNEEPIRALILVGSRAQDRPVDDLADFDIAVFARTCQPYLQEESWLASIGPVWVCVPDQYGVGEEIVQTRLVIYEGGVKVDFAFHTLSLLPKVRWIGGYKVLLDKDGITTGLTRSGRDMPPPSEQDFVRLVSEFWFEAYHVAKYLKREELWLAKWRDGAVKELLLRMMEWWHKSKYGWDYDTHEEGRHLKDWVDPSLWRTLQATFSRFDSTDGWRGLATTLALFRQLARETADRLGFAYPQEVDANIGVFIAGLMPPRLELG